MFFKILYLSVRISLSDRYHPPPLPWDGNTVQICFYWEFIWVFNWLIQNQQYLGSCLSVVRALSLLSLALTAAHQSGHPSGSTLTDLPAMSSRSALLHSFSNSYSSSEPSITHLHGTTFPCKAVFSILPFVFGHRACSQGDLLSLFHLCRSSCGSCHSHILPCPLLSFSLLCSPSGIHSIWLYHLSEHFSFACPPLKNQGFAVLLWFCRATMCVSTCHSCIVVWKQGDNGHTETVKNLWMTLWLCLLSGN